MGIEVWTYAKGLDCDPTVASPSLQGVIATPHRIPADAAGAAIRVAAAPGWGGRPSRRPIRDGDRLVHRHVGSGTATEYVVAQGVAVVTAPDAALKTPSHTRASSNNSDRLKELDIEITSRTATKRFEPNGLVAALLTEPKTFTAIEPDPELSSDISGRQAILFETIEVSLALTPQELDRLIRRDLRPEEVRILGLMNGAFFEIHDDFYDWDSRSYTALQPRRASPGGRGRPFGAESRPAH